MGRSVLTNGDDQRVSYNVKPLQQQIGELTKLGTTDKTSLVNALNEVKSEKEDSSLIGDLTELNTSDKSNLVAAINDNVSQLADISINVKKFGAKGDGINDDTQAIQDAINSLNTNSVTWSLANVGAILIPEGDYLITSPLQIREGVYLIGVSPYASRLRFNFTGGLNGIVNTPTGTNAFTKNFGFYNLSFLPDYNSPGVSSSVFMKLNYVIEPLIRNCRFVMNKGAVGGGQLSATGIQIGKGQNCDFDNIVFDGGVKGIDAESSTDWGMNTSRLRNLFFYDQKDTGLNLLNNSSDNLISNIHIEQVTQTGLNYGIQLDATSGNNVINGVTAQGSNLAYGLIVNSTGNELVGIKVKESKTKKISLGSSDNTLISDKLTIRSGKQTLKTTPQTLTTVSTWYSVAHVHLNGISTGSYVKATITAQIEGVGRVMLKQGWFFGRGTGTITVTENTSEKYSSGTGFAFQWVQGVNQVDMNLQVQFTTGTSVNNAVVVLEMEDGQSLSLLQDGAA